MNGWELWTSKDLLSKMQAIYGVMMDGNHDVQYIRGFTRALMSMAFSVNVRPEEIYDSFQVPQLRSGVPHGAARGTEEAEGENTETGPRSPEAANTYDL
jgi:hypothetical protein